MPSKHYYTHSSGYCFSPANPNGIFTPSNNDPKNLRAHLDIALSGKTLAWHANGNTNDNCDPEIEEACNISDLPDVPLTLLPVFSSGEDCVASFNCFKDTVINTGGVCAADDQKTIENHLLCLITFLASDPLFLFASSVKAYGPICDLNTRPFEVVVIFDNKLAISWGLLFSPDNINIYKNVAPLPFPTTFTCFEITFHDINANVYYSTIKYINNPP
jgi:hypothetical protein